MVLDPWWDAALVGVLGLMVGSFLNVVIYRLPRMMERQWAREHADYARSTAGDTAPAVEPPDAAPFNLAVPRSRCQSCGHQLRWYENIPVLSYLALRGRCSSCKTSFSARYPAVELLTGALFFYCAQRWGLGPAGLAWCGFSALMVALAFIDWDTTLLPDDLTLPLLWAGLLASVFQWTTIPLADAVLGAAAGYLSLWLVYWGFKLLTGKEGMGFGDFKLLGAIGAFLGWKMLPAVILLSSVVGAVVGVSLIVFARHNRATPIPFGPYLAAAGVIAMFWGDAINRQWLSIL